MKKLIMFIIVAVIGLSVIGCGVGSLLKKGSKTPENAMSQITIENVEKENIIEERKVPEVVLLFDNIKEVWDRV